VFLRTYLNKRASTNPLRLNSRKISRRNTRLRSLLKTISQFNKSCFATRRAAKADAKGTWLGIEVYGQWRIYFIRHTTKRNDDGGVAGPCRYAGAGGGGK
jgi:hypothetical protein